MFGLERLVLWSVRSGLITCWSTVRLVPFQGHLLVLLNGLNLSSQCFQGHSQIQLIGISVARLGLRLYVEVR